jgi:hypothetical protein
MAGLFHDTLFALIIRSVLGTTYFPHIDEISPPKVYLGAVRRKASSETTFGPSFEDHDDPMNAGGRDYGAHDEQDAHVTTITTVAESGPLPSALTLVTPEEFTKSEKEEGTDSMLVTWYGPNDPEVRRRCHPFRIPH